MARMILIAIGSHGDVHPILGIAGKLKQLGHEVIVLTNPYFEPLVQRLGFSFRHLGTAEEFQTVSDNPAIWRPVSGFKLLARWGMLHTMEPLYQHLQQLYIPGNTAVAAPITATGARIAQEKLGLPLATIHLQPAIFRSIYESPRLPPMLLGRHVPKWFKKLQFQLADRLLVDPVLAVETNRFRATLGLAPVRNILDRWCLSPQRIVGLFPSWFAAPQLDWPAQTLLTGFPLWDEQEISKANHEVETFLEAGPPPLVFTPGTAMKHGNDFFRVAMEVSRQLGRRAILLSNHTEQIPCQLPPDIVHVDYIPFSQILPRCAALIHHGGIGSTSQGLAAGIPQLIMAMAFDQMDNAARVERLKVGYGLSRRQFRTRRVQTLLAQMLESNEMAAHLRERSSQLVNDTALDKTAALLEKMVGQDQS